MARPSHGTQSMARRPRIELAAAEAHHVVLCRRAWRHRRRGNERRAMLALRDAAHLNESDARLWALYGVQCARVGLIDVAKKALGHAVWLRERCHEPRKAHVTRGVLARLLPYAA